jgi:hypothetical protein
MERDSGQESKEITSKNWIADNEDSLFTILTRRDNPVFLTPSEATELLAKYAAEFHSDSVVVQVLDRIRKMEPEEVVDYRKIDDQLRREHKKQLQRFDKSLGKSIIEWREDFP